MKTVTASAAALALMWAIPTSGQDFQSSWSPPDKEIEFIPAPPGGALVGTVEFANQEGGGGYSFLTFDTPEGVIRLRHYISRNGPDGCCPDTLEAWTVPDGLIVRPSWVEIPEGERTILEVIRWTGG